MKKFIFLAFLLASSSACSESSNIQFIDGWIKQLPPVIPMRAGYIQIQNSSAEAKQIIAVQSDAFEKVEMHETRMSDGMMKMIELKSIDLPAKNSVALKPGGKHLMLISPKQSLQIGDIIKLTATFADESSQQIELEVRK